MTTQVKDNRPTAAEEGSTDIRAITWLNMSGDITITWDSENEAAILALVEKKMKEGFSFFILKPRLLGLLGHKKVVATSVQDVKSAGRAVVQDADFNALVSRMHDADVSELVHQGRAHLARAASSQKESTRRAMSAAEVLCHQTVAVRPVVGG